MRKVFSLEAYYNKNKTDMITKKDITAVINTFSKELRNIPFKNDVELRRKAINMSFRVYDKLINYLAKYPTTISTYRPKHKKGITISLKMKGIGVISIIVYTDHTTVSSYSLGNRTREQKEDYNKVAMICNKHSFLL